MNEDFGMALPSGYQLDEYRIESVLGQGGFGITYLAIDTMLDKKVAIKEYIPSEFAYREDTMTVRPRSPGDEENYNWGLSRFLDEAKTLARFQHPSIVQVNRFIEKNGTAYMVMEYQEGESLRELLTRRDFLPSEADLRPFLSDLLSGLMIVHRADILHRDIKPGNIYIRHSEFDEDVKPVLLDFGAARQALGNVSRSVTAIVTPHYSPYEQYHTGGNQGPWTDIYAMGAVIYRLISGESPPEAPARIRNDPFRPAVEVGGERFGRHFLEAIDWALQVNEEDRPQSIEEWQEFINADSGEEAVTSLPTKKKPAETKSPKKKRSLIGLGVFLVIAVGVGALLFLGIETVIEEAPPREGVRARISPKPLLPLTKTEIAEVQRLLRRVGIDAGRPDGEIGPQTKSAVMRFQQKLGLTLTGKIDRILLRHLREAPPKMEWIVDASGGGDVSSIRQAIRLALPGAKIRIRPGTYQAGFEIRKPLHFEGAGAGSSQVILESRNSSCIKFSAESGSIKGLTLRNVSGDSACVVISRGKLLLEGNDISSKGGSAIRIGGNAEPVIRKNKIHNSNRYGIEVANAKGVFTDNDIYENRLAGIMVGEGGAPTVLRNNIYKGASQGIWIEKNAKGLFEKNNIYLNQSSGIFVTTGGNPVVKNNRIYNGKKNGIFVTGGARGYFEGNEIFNSPEKYPAVVVSDGGDPVFVKNRIHDAKDAGIWILSGGKGRFEKNEIFSNVRANVWVQKKGNPLFKDNIIRDGKGYGVMLQKEGNGHFVNNKIYGNKNSAVGIFDSSNPYFGHNDIQGDKSNAVFVLSKGQGMFEDNEIYNSAENYPVIVVGGGGNPVFLRNRIHDAKASGIWIKGKGHGSFRYNYIYNNRDAGVKVEKGGEPVVMDNHIYGNHEKQILRKSGSGGVFQNNSFAP